MFFDFNKLSERAIIAVVIASVLLILIGFLSNQPFKFFGKEFGFGSEELNKKIAELNDCQNKSSKEIRKLNENLAHALEENSQLNKLNTSLNLSQKALETHEMSPWFPENDITFETSGAYKAQVGKKSGKGKWSALDGGLSLRSISISHGEVILETNLDQPWKNIRFDNEHESWLVTTGKLEYRLTLLSAFDEYEGGEANLRIEKRLGLKQLSE
jgi:hypothetical protein